MGMKQGNEHHNPGQSANACDNVDKLPQVLRLRVKASQPSSALVISS